MSRKSHNRSQSSAHEDDDHDSGEHGPGERLQKVLAAAGVGSRRDCEELIREGRVAIDKQTVTELGTKVDPLRQEIRVDGEALRKPKRQYFAVNKPVGVVTTSHDPSGRERVIDLVPTEERVFAVGRLDRSSEGLILVTNDGEFANRITHPRYGVEKTYLVRVAGSPDQQQLARLKKGVHLAEGYAKAQSIAVKKKHGQSTDLMIVLNEGRNREIRRILARVGHKVLTLKRVAVGTIKLGDLPLGAWRKLLPAEVESLLAVAREKRRERKAKKKESGVRSQESGGGGQRSDVGGQGSAVPTRSASQGPADDTPYIQKQALFDAPLSLDDLLGDDMDEGPIGGPRRSVDSMRDDESGENAGNTNGGVIDYEEDAPQVAPASPPRVRQPEPRGKPVGGKRPLGKPLVGKRSAGKPFRAKQGSGGARPEQRGERGDRSNRSGHRSENRGDHRAEQPREDFGRKRGGKRALGPPHEGRGAAGETAGNFRFAKKAHKKGGPKPQSGKGRRGAAAGQQKFAGKTGSRPGKKFGKPGGKPSGKPGGKRKGRRG